MKIKRHQVYISASAKKKQQTENLPPENKQKYKHFTYSEFPNLL